ncbi:TRAP transporter large permease [Orrella daihaiensis]|uniref:TRAP transporter large permease protein n=1 Tax=Orrella daihaiensis TaxID=2782176 RepID=A0ABY4APX6_9BURK|nr:TRAP transporter large permease subunit [Orrella daihaiensis]UOD50119.1 TRAP transporter large permease subunit [Orrella daihaiensis]
MGDDSGLLISFAIIGTMLLLLGVGVWIGLALIGVAFVAMTTGSSRLPGDAMATTIFGSLSSWTLTSLPLFIWMGEILFRSRLSQLLFNGLSPLFGKFPGRLMQVNVVASTLFAAISGSSAATCATIGKITVPELRQRNYPENMIIGSLAGAGTLGLLIPPSVIMIVYGVTADVSINKLFIAGVIPGLVLAVVYMLYVGGWSLINADKVPKSTTQLGLMQMLATSRDILPPFLLILAVLGSIYAGFATATESAAIGVLGALILSISYGGFGWRIFFTTIMGALKTTTMIMLILAGSSFLTIAMGFTGIPRDLAQWVGSLGLSQWQLLVILTLVFILLGCILDGISMIVLTMAVLLPVVQAAQLDLLWFGIYLILVVEMAQITPPIGLNLFVLQGLTKRDVGFIATASFPFFIILCLMVVLIYLFPELVFWLPNQI